LIGFISCDDLSEVMDSTGMPAKDLSHHGLRSDHPITNPFYERVYKVLLEWIVEYIKLNSEEKMNILDALANEVSSMLAEYFEDEDFSDLWDTEEEEDDDVDGEDAGAPKKKRSRINWGAPPHRAKMETAINDWFQKTGDAVDSNGEAIEDASVFAGLVGIPYHTQYIKVEREVRIC
jgi:hypothetical protein